MASVVSIIGDSASVSLRLESVGDSSSLEGGRGMETLLSIFNCGLPCSQLKAASLYVIGKLGLKILVDGVEQALQGEVLLMEVELLNIREFDSVEVEQGLLVLIFSSVVHGVGGTGQVPWGNSSAKGIHGLGDLGEGN